jgi:hypothetical protein
VNYVVDMQRIYQLRPGATVNSRLNENGHTAYETPNGASFERWIERNSCSPNLP